MKAVVVYNPGSGSAISLETLVKKIEHTNIKVIRCFKADKSLQDKLKRFLSNKDTICITCGGDGTTSAVAQVLMGSKMPLAPLPGGTLNHFTKNLGIDQNLDSAIKNIRTHTPRQIDVACVNNRIIINNSSIGIYPLALRDRDSLQKVRYLKWPAMVAATVKAFTRFKLYTVIIADEQIKTPLLFIGNNDYKLQNGLIGQRDRINEGILSVYAITSTQRRQLLKVLLLIVIGKLPKTPEIKTWHVESLTIEIHEKTVRISRDGEHELIKPPLVYESKKGALTVLH